MRSSFSDAMLRVLFASMVFVAASSKIGRTDTGVSHRSSVVSYNVWSPFERSDSTKRLPDTSCTCHPSLALEIAASAITAGFIEYLATRDFFDDTVIGQHGAPAFIIPGLFLYMVSLAPVSEWTSDCLGNSWNTIWIGFLSQSLCVLTYDFAYGRYHVLDFDKFFWPEYLALGAVPAAITSIVYNQFLHCRPKDGDKHGSDRGMYLLPSVGGDKSLSLNFGMHF